jgi:hypothetical protein
VEANDLYDFLGQVGFPVAAEDGAHE